MTNAEIIYRESQKLMADGVIGTTGRVLVVKNDDGTETRIPEPEPIHTFAAWKEMGFRVKKGEHAKAKFTIWKYSAKKDEENEEVDARMFMKTAHFFTREQVERA